MYLHSTYCRKETAAFEGAEEGREERTQCEVEAKRQAELFEHK